MCIHSPCSSSSWDILPASTQARLQKVLHIKNWQKDIYCHIRVKIKVERIQTHFLLGINQPPGTKQCSGHWRMAHAAAEVCGTVAPPIPCSFPATD